MDTSYTLLYKWTLHGETLSYYVTESEVEIDGVLHTRFGIAIDKSDGDRSEVRDIYGDKDKAAELAGVLYRGKVTPVSLKDIVNDLLFSDEMAVL